MSQIDPNPIPSEALTKALNDSDPLVMSVISRVAQLPKSAQIGRIKALRQATGLTLKEARLVIINTDIPEVDRELTPAERLLADRSAWDLERAKHWAERDQKLIDELREENADYSDKISELDFKVTALVETRALIRTEVLNLQADLATAEEQVEQANAELEDFKVKQQALLDIVLDIVKGSNKATAIKTIQFIKNQAAESRAINCPENS